MSAKPWYPRYPRDFRAKTVHLNMTERGAYDALLDHYYEIQQPLPCDAQSLYRIAGAFTKQDRAAVDRVSREYFTNGNGTLTNIRCDEEIAKMKARSEQQRELVNRRWKRDTKVDTKVDTADGIFDGNTRAPVSQSQSQRTRSNPLVRKSSDGAVSYQPKWFEDFWQAYPRKAAKADAIKAWMQIKPTVDEMNALMPALLIQVTSQQWTKDAGQYIPMPATYLRGKRWTDQPTTPEPENRMGKFHI